MTRGEPDATPEPTDAEAKPAAAGPRITAVRILAAITAALGVAMIVGAIAGGGGIGSYGVLVGAFFVAAGVMRLRLVHLRSKDGR